MLLFTIHSYMNRRKDGKEFFHETKEKAQFAAQSNAAEYESIAEHSKADTLRCDPCKEQGICESAFEKFRLNGKDLCKQCHNAATKYLQ